MKVNKPLNSVTVKAVSLGLKESILINDKVFIKSCKSGLWNFLVISEDTSKGDFCSYVESKHRDRCSAASAIERYKLNRINYELSNDTVTFKIVGVER